MTTYRYQSQATMQHVVCDTCGALVENQTAHSEWHKQMRRYDGEEHITHVARAGTRDGYYWWCTAADCEWWNITDDAVVGRCYPTKQEALDAGVAHEAASNPISR